MVALENTRPRRFDPVRVRTLINDDQAAIIKSALVLLQPSVTQGEWAKAQGLDPVALSKMLNGHWAVTSRYVGPINRLVAAMHPVVVPSDMALAA